MGRAIALQLAVVVFLSATVCHALIPQPFKAVAQHAAKVALVRVVQVDKSVVRAQVLAVLKGRFAGDEVNIHDVGQFFLDMAGRADKWELKPDMRCFVLLNHDNTPVSPFSESHCGGHNILLMGAFGVAQGVYDYGKGTPSRMDEIAADLKAMLPQFKRKDLLPEFEGEFSYRFQDFDRAQVQAPGLTDQELNDQLRLVLTADVKEATAAAARVISGTGDYSRVAAAAAKAEASTPQAQHRRQELLQDLKVVSARRLILNPERHPVKLVGADVAATLGALRQTFNWNPAELAAADKLCLKSVRVTMDLENASLAEVLACLGSQTGIGVYENFRNLYVSGAWGQMPKGGQGLSQARAGALLELDLSKESLKDNPNATCILRYRASTAVPWLSHDDARLRLDETVFADGSTVAGLGVEDHFFPLRLASVVANRGRIKVIKGQLTLQLPMTIGDRVISLGPDHDFPAVMETESGHFFERPSLEQTPGGWKLSVAWGVTGGWRVGAEHGWVGALDADGSVLDGEVTSSGGGSNLSGVQRHGRSMTKVFTKRPAAIRWTYPDLTEDYAFPVEFRDVQFPAAIWQPELPYLPAPKPAEERR